MKVGESIRIGNYAVITLEEKLGQAAKLTIDADRAVKVTRVTHSSPAQIAAAGGISGKA